MEAPYACTGYRLPTEVEWEIAARAGTSTATPMGANSSNNVDEQGWYTNNSLNRAHPVKSKAPNPWGFFDLLGNTKEWVGDIYGTYGGASVIDPTGADSGTAVLLEEGVGKMGQRHCVPERAPFCRPVLEASILDFGLPRVSIQLTLDL